MVYGRVTILGLFMMLFVGIWSSDQPAVRQEYAARHRGNIYVIGGSNPRYPTAPRGVPMNQRPVARVRVVKQSTRSTSNPIPAGAIPRDLSSGRYRVVNDAGLTAIINVTDEWLTRENVPANLPPREFYIHQTATECWYWIRLQPAAGIRTTARL